MDQQESRPKARNRDREGAGKSESSWIKQGLARGAVQSQAYAYRRANPSHPIVLIDGNAGDGVGVPIPQLHLFEDRQSHPTPRMLFEIADKLGGVTVILCERNKVKRESLKRLFPRAIILPNNKDVPAHIRPDHRYALWLSDPCGPSGHGVDAMRKLADDPRIRTDFVVILNEGWITTRLRGTSSPMWATSRQRYSQMVSPLWWARELRKTSVAHSKLVAQSANFHFRLLIVANYLADVARRKEFATTPVPRIVPSGES
jgi:hypothetical protein